MRDKQREREIEKKRQGIKKSGNSQRGFRVVKYESIMLRYEKTQQESESENEKTLSCI